jgi:hypothetical protein
LQESQRFRRQVRFAPRCFRALVDVTCNHPLYAFALAGLAQPETQAGEQGPGGKRNSCLRIPHDREYAGHPTIVTRRVCWDGHHSRIQTPKESGNVFEAWGIKQKDSISRVYSIALQLPGYGSCAAVEFTVGDVRLYLVTIQKKCVGSTIGLR